MDIYFNFLICSSSGYCIRGMAVQLEYFDRLVVSTQLIKPGLHYHPGQWVIQVSDGDLISTPSCLHSFVIPLVST